MMIHVQHAGTGYYLGQPVREGAPGQWVRFKQQARNFPNSLGAFHFCVQHAIDSVNIVVDRGPYRPLVVIPVDADRQSPMAQAPLAAANTKSSAQI